MEKKETAISILIARWKEGTFGEILDDWRWIFGYSKKYTAYILFYTFLGIVSTTLGLVSSVAGKYLIDIITGYQMDKLGILAVIMVGSAVSGLVFNSLLNRLSSKLSIFIHNDIQADVFDKIMDADWMAVNEYSSGDMLNRFNSDVGTVSGNAISWVPTVIIAVYRFIATFIVILHYDVVMALIAFAAAPFTLLISRYMMKRQREHSKTVREMSSKLMTFESEAFYNMDTIKSFGITGLYGQKMRNWQEQYKDVTLAYNLFSIMANAVMSVLGFVVQYAAFGYCLFRLWTNDITYGTMTLFLQQRQNLSNAFNNVVGIVPAFLNSSVSAHRLRELVQLPKEVRIDGSSKMDCYKKDGFTIEMRKADFSYVEGNPIIQESDFYARPGEIVALVGPSGEGKTTMIRLILGLVHPKGGQVLLCGEITDQDGGKRIDQVEMNADIRYLFSYVPQGNTILSGTVADNMRMVKPDATDDEIREALKTACAWNFIENLPNGIYSNIGEKGKGFSEGQAQRIAIARAILRDAPILLLDEATSALDVTTERQVLKNIMKQHPNKTCIVTTHRPSVLNICKRVYRVVETKVMELSEEESSRMAMDF